MGIQKPDLHSHVTASSHSHSSPPVKQQHKSSKPPPKPVPEDDADEVEGEDEDNIPLVTDAEGEDGWVDEDEIEPVKPVKAHTHRHEPEVHSKNRPIANEKVKSSKMLDAPEDLDDPPLEADLNDDDEVFEEQAGVQAKSSAHNHKEEENYVDDDGLDEEQQEDEPDLESELDVEPIKEKKTSKLTSSPAPVVEDSSKKSSEKKDKQKTETVVVPDKVEPVPKDTKSQKAEGELQDGGEDEDEDDEPAETADAPSVGAKGEEGEEEEEEEEEEPLEPDEIKLNNSVEKPSKLAVNREDDDEDQPKSDDDNKELDKAKPNSPRLPHVRTRDISPALNAGKKKSASASPVHDSSDRENADMLSAKVEAKTSAQDKSFGTRLANVPSGSTSRNKASAKSSSTAFAVEAQKDEPYSDDEMDLDIDDDKVGTDEKGSIAKEENGDIDDAEGDEDEGEGGGVEAAATVDDPVETDEQDNKEDLTAKLLSTESASKNQIQHKGHQSRTSDNASKMPLPSLASTKKGAQPKVINEAKTILRAESGSHAAQLVSSKSAAPSHTPAQGKVKDRPASSIEKNQSRPPREQQSEINKEEVEGEAGDVQDSAHEEDDGNDFEDNEKDYEDYGLDQEGDAEHKASSASNKKSIDDKLDNKHNSSRSMDDYEDDELEQADEDYGGEQDPQDGAEEGSDMERESEKRDRTSRSKNSKHADTQATLTQDSADDWQEAEEDEVPPKHRVQQVKSHQIAKSQNRMSQRLDSTSADYLAEDEYSVHKKTGIHASHMAKDIPKTSITSGKIASRKLLSKAGPVMHEKESGNAIQKDRIEKKLAGPSQTETRKHLQSDSMASVNGDEEDDNRLFDDDEGDEDEMGDGMEDADDVEGEEISRTATNMNEDANGNEEDDVDSMVEGEDMEDEEEQSRSTSSKNHTTKPTETTSRSKGFDAPDAPSTKDISKQGAMHRLSGDAVWKPSKNINKPIPQEIQGPVTMPPSIDPFLPPPSATSADFPGAQPPSSVIHSQEFYTFTDSEGHHHAAPIPVQSPLTMQFPESSNDKSVTAPAVPPKPVSRPEDHTHEHHHHHQPGLVKFPGVPDGPLELHDQQGNKYIWDANVGLYPFHPNPAHHHDHVPLPEQQQQQIPLKQINLAQSYAATNSRAHPPPNRQPQQVYEHPQQYEPQQNYQQQPQAYQHAPNYYQPPQNYQPTPQSNQPANSRPRAYMPPQVERHDMRQDAQMVPQYIPSAGHHSHQPREPPHKKDGLLAKLGKIL